MKRWKVGYEVGCGFVDYEWVDGETKAQAKRLWKAVSVGTEAKIVSVEEQVDVSKLFCEAEEKIVEALAKTKNLEVDDSRGTENWCQIPVWDVRTYNGDGYLGGTSPVREFTFNRDSYESEAEMVERFHRELSEFVGQNWKRIDR